MNILWDFDGTIFDTYPTIVQTFKRLINDKHVSDEEVLEKLKVSSLHAMDYFGVEKEEFDKTFHQQERELDVREKPPFAHVEEVLKAATCNVIVTHKAKKSAVDILTHYKLKHYFTEIIALDDGYNRKPDPQSYRYLHNLYHIDLVIGDRELDLQPGREIGIKTCAFQNTHLEADFHIQDYQQFFTRVMPHL